MRLPGKVLKMANTYLDDLAITLDRLPPDKAQEIVDFAQFLLHKTQVSGEVNTEAISWEHDPLWDIVDLGESGVTDGSVEHDKYLYGKGHSCKSAAYWQFRETGEL
jgi:hypothetical protein